MEPPTNDHFYFDDEHLLDSIENIFKKARM